MKQSDKTPSWKWGGGNWQRRSDLHCQLSSLAVREAIVNAVCHRDYTDNGSVQVMLFRNRLEIINPREGGKRTGKEQGHSTKQGGVNFYE